MKRAITNPRNVLPAAAAGIAAIAALTVVGKLVGLNQTTIGLVYLLVIFLLASWRGLVAGATASVLATICFNFFFLPPLYRFVIADPANWVALVTFVAASFVANRLLVRVQRQAAAAEESRNELRALYDAPDLDVDPALTLELLVNLIENADRASPDGQPVELMAEQAANGMVRIEVRDRGPGVTPRKQDFDDVEGRGLGLEIVRNLVRVQGGTFELRNRDGGGAVARVELPAARVVALEEQN